LEDVRHAPKRSPLQLFVPISSVDCATHTGIQVLNFSTSAAAAAAAAHGKLLPAAFVLGVPPLLLLIMMSIMLLLLA
jgi:hypothetical protein